MRGEFLQDFVSKTKNVLCYFSFSAFLTENIRRVVQITLIREQHETIVNNDSRILGLVGLRSHGNSYLR
jgi:hypothetical protein